MTWNSASMIRQQMIAAGWKSKVVRKENGDYKVVSVRVVR